MSTLKLEFAFNVPRKCIYETFVDQMRIMQYTRSKAQVVNQEGGNFMMLDGKILGKFLTLRPDQYIKMQWKFNDWDNFSIVEIILQEQQEDQCDIIINQNKIPSSVPKQKMQFGWKNIIIEPMSKILGYPFRN